MKKLFTLCAAVVMGCMAASAQIDNTFQFVDKDGNVVADGTTWHAYEKHDSIVDNPISGQPMDMGTMVLSGLYVKNTSSETANCSVDFQVTQIDGGTFQICFPTTCLGQNAVMNKVMSTGSGEMAGGESRDMLTEWVVRGMGGTTETTGTCTATIQLKVMNPLEEGQFVNTFKAYGPKITVVFHNDGTIDGIAGVEAGAGKEPVAYYSLDGRRLGVAQKGLNIVKYADGTTAKVVVK